MYTKQLSFLLDVMQVGPTKDNLEEEEDSDETQIEEPDVALGTARSTSTPVTAEPTTVDNPVCAAEEEIIPRGKRRRSAKGPTRTEPRQEVDLRVLEHLEKRATETEEGTFCRALSNILKRVPISRQIRCQTALMEVVEIFATHPDPRAMHQAIEFHRRGCDASTFNCVPPAPAATAQGGSKALKWLSNHKDIVVKPADKGGNMILLMKDYYVSESMRQLNEEGVYETLSKDPTLTYQN
ncbi:uncharacterized protein LOC142760519 [Rhinoderma darwinii]|uniref:uncharacterized protein LOC142760519 n=1 Tax=Rhinoderma darwinii TaxID=43563 RepID=UPI003F66BE19